MGKQRKGHLIKPLTLTKRMHAHKRRHTHQQHTYLQPQYKWKRGREMKKYSANFLKKKKSSNHTSVKLRQEK